MALSRSDLEALAATYIRDPIPQESLIPAITSPPFIPTLSFINLRDIGAVPGSGIRPNRIFRCGTLNPASQDPDALAWMSANVKAIFDLRTPHERANDPSPEFEGVSNIYVEPAGSYGSPKLEDFVAGEGDDAWKKQYLHIAETGKPIIRKILEHVRDNTTKPFLFHCTAGRDRTGLVAGLLESLAGTAPSDVVLDYMLSRIGIEPARERLAAFAMASAGVTVLDTPGLWSMVSLQPSYWNAFIEGLKEEYGGWEGYVTEGLGFTERDLETIKMNLRS